MVTTLALLNYYSTFAMSGISRRGSLKFIKAIFLASFKFKDKCSLKTYVWIFFNPKKIKCTEYFAEVIS